MASSSYIESVIDMLISSTKKQKVTVTGPEETLDDRLSELPEFLLIQILSLMPTKDAMKTCVLSKRWRYLSTFIYNFKFYRANADSAENFVSFVDYVFAHSVSSKIKKLQISYGSLYQYKSRISQWLTFAVERNVQDIFIGSRDEATFALPESFRTCSSLITLDCLYNPFVIDGVIEWKSLKRLRLVCLVISDDDMVNLLSGCPALEIMELGLFRGFHRLKINSSKLKTLTLGSYKRANDEIDHSLEIIAPNLRHLQISGGLYDLKCRLVDVSSVVNANLTFKIRCIKDILGDRDDEDSCRDYHQVFSTLFLDYLQKLTCATELTIGTWFTKVLCMLQHKGVSIPELKCKYLKLELHMDKFNLSGVAGLLRASPLMETLNLDMATMLLDNPNSLCHFESRNLAEGDTIDLQNWTSSFVFPNLKKVKIVISFKVLLWMLNGNYCLKDRSKWGFDKLFKLSEFLLKAATTLEKFVIISKRMKRETCQACSTNCLSLYKSRLAEKLLGCTRSSATSVIVCEESTFPLTK